MARSVLDFYVVQPGISEAEPTLRDLVYKYYGAHFSEEKTVQLAREYLRQVEAYIAGAKP